ncbi:hypothetical protein D3C81_1709070 [compost metagenome]
MIDLHPGLSSATAASIGPQLEFAQVAIVLKHHAGGSGQSVAINHDVASDDQAGPTLRPAPIELDQCFPRSVILIGKVLLHGSLGDSVWNHRAVR